LHALIEQPACEPGIGPRQPVVRGTEVATKAARGVALRVRAAAFAAILVLGIATAGAQVVPAGSAGDAAADAANVHAPAGDIAGRLDEADRIRRSDPAGFRDALARLDLDQAAMTPAQRERYTYLRGWERVFAADVERGIAILTTLRDGAKDPVIRIRAGATLVHAYNLSRRWSEAFEQLKDVLDLLPQVDDVEARAQVLSVTAQLYVQTGQYDLAIEQADRVIREPGVDWAQCFVAQIKYDAIERKATAATPDAALDEWIRRCTEQGEDILAGYLRVSRARMLVRIGDHRGAAADLDQGYATVQRLDYAPLLGTYEAAYAEALLGLGDEAQARRHALAALAAMQSTRANEPTVRALRTLYQVAKATGESGQALSWHEQYVATEAAWSTDRNERLLAFLMASHETRARAIAIDRLASENQALQLRQQIGNATARVQQLAIALLLVVLASIAFWSWRLKQSRERYRRQAQQDALTSIAARQHFMAQAAAALAECRRSAQPAALVLIDLDHFKQINDAYGHVAGDEVLRKAAAACTPRLGERALFGRIGGEEFGVLLPDASEAAAIAVAEACRAALQSLDRLDDGRAITVTASFGVAVAVADGGQDLRQLLIHADVALYEAKRQGRNCVVAWEPSLSRPRVVPVAAAQQARQA
jgi:diguanylate cyclase (GGDEF)-like protein